MAAASPNRSSRSTVSTTSAASEAAVAPRAPSATPTSARASAGASLIPSPTIMVGARRVSSLHDVELLGGSALGQHLVDADHGTDRLGHLRPVPGDHDDALHAVPAQRAQCPRRIRPERVVEHQDAGRCSVDTDEDGQGAVELRLAARRARPGGGARHPAPRRLAHGHVPAGDGSADALAGDLLHPDGKVEGAAPLERRPDHGAGEDVRGHLVERGGELEDRVGGHRAGADDPGERRTPDRHRARLVDQQGRARGQPLEDGAPLDHHATVGGAGQPGRRARPVRRG